MKFKSNIELQAGLEDNNATPGTPGQVLSSTGNAGGVEWIDQSALTDVQSNFVYFDVKNETGLTIFKGKGVMAVGTDGNSGHILIDEMVADGSVEAKYFLGVLETTVANGEFARVISFGQLDQFNTLGQNGETWSDGQVLWCDPDSAGDFTITEPDGPNVKIAAAIILNSSTNGKIQVRVQANEGIHDLHDTKITSQVDGDVLVWDNTTGVWFNDSTLNVDYTNSRVGIGTASPESKLEVKGNTANALLTLKSEDGGANDAFMRFFDEASGPSYSVGLDSSDEKFKIAYDTDGDSLTTGTKLVIDTLGRVGIGTTSPSEKLTVNGNIAATGTITGSNLSGTNTGDQTLASLGAAAAVHTHTWASIPNNSVNGWGGLRHTTPSGYIDFGPANSGHAHIYTDRPDFYFNKELLVNNNRVFHQGYHPNADTLTTARTISLTGDVTGSVSFNGSSNVSITATVVDDSHSHTHLNSDGTSEAPDNALQYFQTSSNTSINPSSDWYNTIRMGHGDPVTYYSNTIAVKMTGSNVGDLYTRTISSGTAQSWNRFWHNNNDGSGSGLDADLLDGVQGSSYLRSDTSDTFTGTLTMSGSINFGSSNGNINLSRGGFITFYEDGNSHHGIGSRNNSGSEADDIRINSYGAVYINLDSNNNNTSGADFVIGRHGSATGTISELFRVSGESGNVGIGTTSPGSKLEVKGDTANALLSLTSSSGGSNDAFMRFYDEGNSGASYSMGLDSSDEKFKIAFDYDNDSLTTGTKLVIDTSGNVGIGTTSPGQKLQVSGNVLADQFRFAAGFVMRPVFGSLYLETTNGARFQNSSGTLKPVTASAFNTSSDYRLKSNIVPLENAINRLNQLEVHRFNWNDRLDKPKVDGFIAHEVASVIPEAVLGEKDAVHEDGTPDYQGIDQSKIVPLLTAALQEAISKIEQLEARIQTLENK